MSFANTLKAAMDDKTVAEYPFIRRDKQVRARVIERFNDDNCEPKEMVLIETIEPGHRLRNPCKRVVTEEYFENNYWEGKN